MKEDFQNSHPSFFRQSKKTEKKVFSRLVANQRSLVFVVSQLEREKITECGLFQARPDIQDFVVLNYVELDGP